MAIYRIEQHAPVVPGSAWVAETATVIGRVELGEEASIWYGATLRGDNDRIAIGARSNVQESSVLLDPIDGHGTPAGRKRAF